MVQVGCYIVQCQFVGQIEYLVVVQCIEDRCGGVMIVWFVEYCDFCVGYWVVCCDQVFEQFIEVFVWLDFVGGRCGWVNGQLGLFIVEGFQCVFVVVIGYVECWIWYMIKVQDGGCFFDFVDWGFWVFEDVVLFCLEEIVGV